MSPEIATIAKKVDLWESVPFAHQKTVCNVPWVSWGMPGDGTVGGEGHGVSGRGAGSYN